MVQSHPSAGGGQKIDGSGQFELRTSFDGLGKARPAAGALGLEHREVKSNVLGRMRGNESGDGGLGLVVSDFGRQLGDLAFAIVSDADAVEEGGEHVRLAFEEPDLEDLLGNAFIRAHAELVEEPGGLLVLRSLVDEGGAQFALRGEGVDDGLVSGALVVLHVAHEIELHFGADGGENLVGSHGKGGPVSTMRAGGRQDGE